LPEIFGRIIEFIAKLSPRIAGTVFLFCLMILLLPTRIVAWLDFASTLKAYRLPLVLALLASGAYLATFALHHFWKSLTDYIQRIRARVRAKKRLHSLSHDEKKLLQSYITHATLTRRWNLGSGVVNGLVAEGLLVAASKYGSQAEGFAFNMKPWAYDYIFKHPELIATPGDTSEPDAFP
jgi:hypothetical protein